MTTAGWFSAARLASWLAMVSVLASGCGAVQPSVVPSRSSTPAPSQPAAATPAPSTSAIQTASDQPTVLSAAADGLRVRVEPSVDAAATATLWAGQQMGVVSGPITAAGMDWYEIRIGPSDLRGWVAAGPDGAWLREVRNGDIAFGCDACLQDDDPQTVGPIPATVVASAVGEPALAAVAFATTTHAWSPDGAQMAVTMAGMDSTTIAVIDVRSGNRRDLGWGNGPSWSPDGERLAWIRGPGVGGVPSEVLRSLIVFADVGSWETTEVAIDGVVHGSSPMSWSPDGGQLAVVGIDCRLCSLDDLMLGDPPLAIFTVATDGGGLRQLTGGSIDGLPTWSPDGTQLLFMRYDLSGERPNQAHVISPDGGDPTPLFEREAIHAAPAWSPDGTRLVVGTAEGLVVSDGDGANASVLVPAAGSAVLEVHWSPDGRHIAYGIADNEGRDSPAVWVTPADGSATPRRISPDGTYAVGAAWQSILVPLP